MSNKLKCTEGFLTLEDEVAKDIEARKNARHDLILQMWQAGPLPFGNGIEAVENELTRRGFNGIVVLRAKDGVDLAALICNMRCEIDALNKMVSS